MFHLFAIVSTPYGIPSAAVGEGARVKVTQVSGQDVLVLLLLQGYDNVILSVDVANLKSIPVFWGVLVQPCVPRWKTTETTFIIFPVVRVLLKWAKKINIVQYYSMLKPRGLNIVRVG